MGNKISFPPGEMVCAEGRTNHYGYKHGNKNYKTFANSLQTAGGTATGQDHTQAKKKTADDCMQSEGMEPAGNDLTVEMSVSLQQTDTGQGNNDHENYSPGQTVIAKKEKVLVRGGEAYSGAVQYKAQGYSNQPQINKLRLDKI